MNFRRTFLAIRITMAIIFYKLYFKFTAHPDSVYIFSKLGVEPYGRIGLGIIELITSLLILYLRTKIIGILCHWRHHYRSFVFPWWLYRFWGKGRQLHLVLLALVVLAAGTITDPIHKRWSETFIQKFVKKWTKFIFLFLLVIGNR